jgi:hypothetical protein
MFDGAERKLDRAKEHIVDLQTQFRAFAHSHPYTASTKVTAKDGKISEVWFEIEFSTPLPSKLALILGDAIHNLRCVLDHSVWELIGIDGGTQDRWTKFPTGRSRVDFESSVRGMKTPRQDTKQFLTDLAAYPTGEGELLYGLNSLDNEDKHTITTPVAHAAAVEGLTFVDLITGKKLRADTLITDPSFDRTARLVTTLPGWGIDAKSEVDLTPEIFFGEVDVLSNEPIIPTLVHVSDAVSDTLRQMRRLVSSRA